MLAAAATLSGVAAAAPPNNCRKALLAAPAIGGAERHPLKARDLVKLRDFGRTDSAAAGDAVFTVSPDQQMAALILRRADLDHDTYCYGVVVVPLAGGAPRLIDVGGERIPATSDIRGIPAIDSGLPDAPAPVWSKDGKWIAFLRRDRNITRLWRASPYGRSAQQVSNLPTDALSLALAPDSKEIRVTTRPALAAAIRDTDREGASGFLYDARFWTLSEASPRPRLPLPEIAVAIDLNTGRERTMHDGAATPSIGGPKGAALYARSSMGEAWTVQDNGELAFAPYVLHVRARGINLPCPGDVCGSRVAALWWIGPDELLFLRSGGPENGGRTGLYRWRVSSQKAPEKLLETIDALIGCTAVSRQLICAKETASDPRRLVSIEIDSGVTTTIFDPNPEFAGFSKGTVQRLIWADGDGNHSYGDLVLPPDHFAGQRHPLIVVQYISQGFLRGGTGDEYPIRLFAQAGFAVLSFQRPLGIAGRATATDLVALQRLNIAGWRERRIIAGSLLAGVDAAIATGSIDPKRIGITGMSDGGTTTQFLLVNSNRFKAAAVSSCCDDPSGLFVVGPAYRDFVLQTGYPASGIGDQAFWAAMSLSRNAATMTTPLLIQEPDMEYRLSQEAVSALQIHHAPVEMYVFPDERHVKFHPVHRLAAYERSLAWFDFWLQGRTSTDPERATEIRRWESMRQKKAAAIWQGS